MDQRCLLLDLDGTALDSLDHLFEVYERFLKDHRAVPSKSEFHSLNGVLLKSVVARLKKQHHLSSSLEELLKHYTKLLSDLPTHAKPRVGLVELLLWAHSEHWRTGLVTSASHSYANAWLERFNLVKHFEVLVTSDDVESGKPEPEPYEKAMRALDCLPQNAVVVEDSESGVTSGLSAGARTFLIAPAGPPRWFTGAWEKKDVKLVTDFISLKEILSHE